MKLLTLYLTSLKDTTRFKVIINDANQDRDAETESSLLCDGYDWRITVLKALEASNFRPADFKSEEERSWMVKFGLLAADQTTFRPDMLENIGRLLYRTLFPDSTDEGRKVAGLLQEAIRFAEGEGSQLHIRIKFNDKIGNLARLPDYPWELLHDGGGFLAQRQVGFSRCIAYEAPPPNLPSVNKVKVLLVSSMACDLKTGLKRLPDLEKQAIKKSLARSQKEGRIRLFELRPATFDKLRAYLTKNRGDDSPHVIHFDGHGFYGKRCKRCQTMHSGITDDTCESCGDLLGQPQGFLLFEDNTVGGSEYISANQLGDLLRQANLSDSPRKQSGIALVVLSACQSGLSMGDNSVFNGIAQSLIDNRVPAVVAMPFSVEVAKAAAFSEQFYRCLDQKDPLVKAVSWGREAMGSEINQWYRPVLYLRWKDNEGGQMFAPSLTSPPASIVEPGAKSQQTSQSRKRKTDKGPKSFKIVVESNDEIRVENRDIKPCKVNSDALLWKTIKILNDMLRDNRLRHQEEYKVLGANLYAVLFNNAIGEELNKLRYEELQREEFLRVELEFKADQDDLAGWPWEYLYCPLGGGYFVAEQAKLVLTRCPAPPDLPERLLPVPNSKLPIKVLFVAPSPNNLDRVEYEGVLRELNAHGEMIEVFSLVDPFRSPNDRIAEEYKPKATYDNFIHTVDNFEPHVVHFVGHSCWVDDVGGHLAFMDQDGEVDWKSAEALTRSLGQKQFVRLILLQACENKLPTVNNLYSLYQTTSNAVMHYNPYHAISDVAKHLAQDNIPAVVAMQYRKSDASNRFASAFYGALVESRSIDDAMQKGRLQLLTEEWTKSSSGLPALFLRQSGALLAPKSGVGRQSPMPGSLLGERPASWSRPGERHEEDQLLQVDGTASGMKNFKHP